MSYGIGTKFLFHKTFPKCNVWHKCKKYSNMRMIQKCVWLWLWKNEMWSERICREQWRGRIDKLRCRKRNVIFFERLSGEKKTRGGKTETPVSPCLYLCCPTERTLEFIVLCVLFLFSYPSYTTPVKRHDPVNESCPRQPTSPSKQSTKLSTFNFYTAQFSVCCWLLSEHLLNRPLRLSDRLSPSSLILRLHCFVLFYTCSKSPLDI